MKQRGSSVGRVAGVAFCIALAAQTALSPVAWAQSGAAQTQAKPAPANSGPRTLAEALALAYSTDGTLLAERANVRAVDENVAGALAGWRPTVTVSSNAGYANDNRITHAFLPTRTTRQMVDRGLNSETVTATQQLYSGGATKAATNKAENQVMAERGRLLAQEQATLLAAVQAYVGVIQATQLLALNQSNEQVLSQQLIATNDRFRVGELTRTDVAQSEAALAGATANRQTAEGNLQTARATFRNTVGALPGTLIEPQPLKLPVRTLEQAQSLARTNNPTVVAALFDDAAAKDNFDAQFARLMPTLSLQASYGRSEDTTAKNLQANTGSITAILSLPLYQGGAEYAAIRQAKQAQIVTRQKLEASRGTAVQQVAAAWSTYGAAKAAIESTRRQIAANEVALEGVQRQALVGSLTTLDVLNAEQALLTSRTTLVQNLANLVSASYQVASGVGRLTARDLALGVPLYDETAYYKAVRNRLIGTGDYATDQPSR